MAIAIYFNPQALTAAVYDEAVKVLEARGARNPDGRLYHCTFGSDEKLQVFDIWDSLEDFQKFGETMLPVAAECGIDLGQPVIEPVHDIITPS